MVTRVGQAGLTLALAVYYLLVAFNNVLDYETNFEYVRHVMSMDSIPANSHVAWHAIRSSEMAHLAYWGIIAWEGLAGILCAMGGARMALRVKSEEFNSAKTYALAGLWIGALLWSLAFLTIGGEWFQMWQSPTWNGQMAAFRMFTVNGVALLLVYLRE